MRFSEDFTLSKIDNAAQHSSRRARRAAEVSAKNVIKPKSRALRNGATMLAAAGLLATSSLPSYGFDPATTARAGLTHDNQTVALSTPAQGLSVATVRAVEFTRGEFRPAEASEFEVRVARAPRIVYSGPTAADFWKTPRFSSVTSGFVMQAAAEQVGVPYVYGGSTPSGFDCSGYVRFIYSQFGVKLPHSVYQQSKMAKKIAPEDARPGDIVVFNDYSHNGIYAGNGNYYHAPQPGDRVKLAPISTERYHFVRFVDFEG
jgi:peptidoglycan DL-endopeptidase CwlO